MCLVGQVEHLPFFLFKTKHLLLKLVNKSLVFSQVFAFFLLSSEFVLLYFEELAVLRLQFSTQFLYFLFRLPFLLRDTPFLLHEFDFVLGFHKSVGQVLNIRTVILLGRLTQLRPLIPLIVLLEPFHKLLQLALLQHLY